MSAMQGPSSPVKLPCGHFFHYSCVRKWLERVNSCPLCRTSLKDTPQLCAEGGLDSFPRNRRLTLRELSRARSYYYDAPTMSPCCQLDAHWDAPMRSPCSYAHVYACMMPARRRGASAVRRLPTVSGGGALIPAPLPTPSWAGAVSRALPQRTLTLARTRIKSSHTSHLHSQTTPRSHRRASRVLHPLSYERNC